MATETADGGVVWVNTRDSDRLVTVSLQVGPGLAELSPDAAEQVASELRQAARTARLMLADHQR